MEKLKSHKPDFVTLPCALHVMLCNRWAFLLVSLVYVNNVNPLYCNIRGNPSHITERSQGWRQYMLFSSVAQTLEGPEPHGICWALLVFLTSEGARGKLQWLAEVNLLKALETNRNSIFWVEFSHPAELPNLPAEWNVDVKSSTYIHINASSTTSPMPEDSKCNWGHGEVYKSTSHVEMLYSPPCE